MTNTQATNLAAGRAKGVSRTPKLVAVKLDLEPGFAHLVPLMRRATKPAMRVVEVCAVLNVSRQTVHEMLNNGLLAGFTVRGSEDSDGQHRVLASSVLAYMAEESLPHGSDASVPVKTCFHLLWCLLECLGLPMLMALQRRCNELVDVLQRRVKTVPTEAQIDELVNAAKAAHQERQRRNNATPKATQPRLF